MGDESEGLALVSERERVPADCAMGDTLPEDVDFFLLKSGIVERVWRDSEASTRHVQQRNRKKARELVHTCGCDAALMRISSAAD